MKIGQQVNYEWIDGRNRWQFYSKTEKVSTSLYPGRGTLMNKRVPKQGRRYKNFRGEGSTKKDRKIAKSKKSAPRFRCPCT